MENSIIKDFQNLQVLNSYDFKRMDELVQDLTKALEDTARSQPKSSRENHEVSALSGHSKGNRKRRARKRRPVTASCSGGHFSEASESSIEKLLLRNSAHPSDSDELLCAEKGQVAAVYPLPSTYPLALVESDSVNECFSPMRPHRRKRHFKRMAVDPDSDTSSKVNCHDGYVAMPLCPVMDRDTSECNMDEENKGVSANCPTASQVLPGKRKRAVKDKSFDTENLVGEAADITEGDAPSVERSTSSISSSESDGLFTNDEGRDGDDEQSDFFYEPGPACGITGIIPWWETERFQQDPPTARDLKFEAILKGSFEYMSAAAQRSFKRRLKLIGKSGREIRLGRRRCKEKNPGYTLSRFLQDREQWSDSLRLLTGSQFSDPKRRRKTPPTSANESEIVGASAEPIPASNLGNQMLRNLGWNPGTGLGLDGSGIMTPIMAVKRPGRQGLGQAGGGNDEMT